MSKRQQRKVRRDAFRATAWVFGQAPKEGAPVFRIGPSGADEAVGVVRKFRRTGARPMRHHLEGPLGGIASTPAFLVELEGPRPSAWIALVWRASGPENRMSSIGEILKTARWVIVDRASLEPYEFFRTAYREANKT